MDSRDHFFTQPHAMSIFVLHRELENFPELFDPFVLLIDFVGKLETGHFTKGKSGWWTYSRNFISLSCYYKRSHHITVSLWGRTWEFLELEHLLLGRSRGGSYSKCKVNSVSQMDALLVHVRRSHALWSEGRGREKRSLKIVEE